MNLEEIQGLFVALYLIFNALVLNRSKTKAFKVYSKFSPQFIWVMGLYEKI